jgi:hypothetical protein
MEQNSLGHVPRLLAAGAAPATANTTAGAQTGRTAAYALPR